MVLRPCRAGAQLVEHRAPVCAAHPERAVARLARYALAEEPVVPLRKRQPLRNTHRKMREGKRRKKYRPVLHWQTIFVIFRLHAPKLGDETQLACLWMYVALVAVSARFLRRTHVGGPATVAQRLGKRLPVGIKLHDARLSAPHKVGVAHHIDFLPHRHPGEGLRNVHVIGYVSVCRSRRVCTEHYAIAERLHLHALRQLPLPPVRHSKGVREEVIDPGRIGKRGRLIAALADETLRPCRNAEPETDGAGCLAAVHQRVEFLAVREHAEGFRAHPVREEFRLVGHVGPVRGIPFK